MESQTAARHQPRPDALTWTPAHRAEFRHDLRPARPLQEPLPEVIRTQRWGIEGSSSGSTVRVAWQSLTAAGAREELRVGAACRRVLQGESGHPAARRDTCRGHRDRGDLHSHRAQHRSRPGVGDLHRRTMTRWCRSGVQGGEIGPTGGCSSDGIAPAGGIRRSRSLRHRRQDRVSEGGGEIRVSCPVPRRCPDRHRQWSGRRGLREEDRRPRGGRGPQPGRHVVYSAEEFLAHRRQGPGNQME